jgi:hypothetical protein
MKLYSRTGATTVSSDGVDYVADVDGGIVLPDELSKELHNVFVDGQRAWEDEGERVTRLAEEEHARISDPGYLATLVAELSAKLDNQAPAKKPAKVAEPVVVEADAPAKPAKSAK